MRRGDGVEEAMALHQSEENILTRTLATARVSRTSWQQTPTSTRAKRTVPKSRAGHRTRRFSLSCMPRESSMATKSIDYIVDTGWRDSDLTCADCGSSRRYGQSLPKVSDTVIRISAS